MDKEDIDDFEDEKLDIVKKSKKGWKERGEDEISIESSQLSEGSASVTLLSSHAMRMGLYTINLGTKTGQRLHTGHMLFLPLIPVFILLGQNVGSFLSYVGNAREIINVQIQVKPHVPSLIWFRNVLTNVFLFENDHSLLILICLCLGYASRRFGVAGRTVTG